MRVATLNMWHDLPTWTIRQPFLHAELAAVDADVVCLQEALDGPNGDPLQQLAERHGYTVGVRHHLAPISDTAHAGLAILTRLPVVATGLYALPSEPTPAHFPAYAIWAVVLSHSGRPWLLVTTHLAWGVVEHVRLQQARSLNTYITDLVAELNLHGSPVVLAGDFNALPDGATLRYLTGLSELPTDTLWVDAWAAAGNGGPGFTSTPTNMWTRHLLAEHGAALPHTAPARRIDYVLTRGWTYGRPGHPLNTQLAFTGTSDTPPASDHYGLVVDLYDPPVDNTSDAPRAG